MKIRKTDNYKLSINLKSSKIGKFVKALPLLSFSDKLKKGFKEEVELRDGLKIVINEYKLKKNIAIDFSIKNAPLEFAFCLSGKMNIEVSSENGLTNYIEISTGSCSIFYLPNSSGIIRIPGNENLKILSLHVSPDYLKTFLEDDHAGFPQHIAESIWGIKPKPFVLIGKMNSLMTMSGNQILENVFSGSPRNMFLEAKALELMTLMLAHIHSNYSESKELLLSESEKEKLTELEKFINSNLAQLPSLQELAGRVSMTHTKLNKAFRVMFGDTVFCYVRDKRLEEAKNQLSENLRVTEIAYKLGYSSPAHLSRDFREKYGISPKAYQKSLK